MSMDWLIKVDRLAAFAGIRQVFVPNLNWDNLVELGADSVGVNCASIDIEDSDAITKCDGVTQTRLIHATKCTLRGTRRRYLALSCIHSSVEVTWVHR